MRRHPIYLQKQIDSEIIRLEEAGIIESVEGPQEWVSNLVATPKSDNSVRLCLDARSINTAIQGEIHPIPTLESILDDMHGGKIFSKIDMKEAYTQIDLEEESRELTNFHTSFGIKRFKRLCYGINNAFEVFQRSLDQTIGKLRNVKCISDDIIVYNKNYAEHLETLKELFTKIKELGLRLTTRKCVFMKESISFLGVVISSEGVKPTPEKIQTPLRLLLKKGTKFICGTEQQKAFDELKDCLVSNKVSISRSLTETEKRYGITEKEALSVVWCIEKYHHYLYGMKFKLTVDHKPLQFIFKPQAKLSSRIARWQLKLQAYDFDINYFCGEQTITDFLSRQRNAQPLDEDRTNQYINFITKHSTPMSISQNEIRNETSKDCELQLISNAIKTGNWDNLKEYKIMQQEFCEVDGIILPINIAHQGHLGVQKVKNLLRSKFYWKGMESHITEALSKCRACQSAGPYHAPTPLIPSPLPNHPWKELAIDVFGPLPSGDKLLVVIDLYSRYPIVEVVKNTITSNMINKLEKIFSLFRYPEKVRIDCFTLVTVDPLYASDASVKFWVSNGGADRPDFNEFKTHVPHQTIAPSSIFHSSSTSTSTSIDSIKKPYDFSKHFSKFTDF
ncbi:uncharacterized protein K02A2.6-like [Hydractinia symbiolongicarpus]|uniref:uncharacterized protein K02A2.6-like n=1 Tax=Hydractinia symbiolongicarpus TaxID=13093 RepID=UPI00254D8AB6|nr:uncharacterized protein K02A2.6-like [Hydractinia symbiolongicarpus]